MDPPNDLYSTTLASIDSADTLCNIARPFIRAKARRLVGTAGFSRSDQDDIEQEAALRLVERFVAAKETCTLPVLAFIKSVVSQSIANQIRNRRAQKRDCRRTRSLNRKGSRDADGEIGDWLPDDSVGGVGRILELGLDVKEVVAQLAKDQQELCALLGVESIADLARRFKKPRSTVQDKAHRLQAKFKERGMDGSG